MSKLSSFVSQVGLSINRNSPTILMVSGIAGFIGTVLFAIEAAPKADRALKREKDTLEPREALRIVLPYYVPTILMGTVSTAAIVLGNRIHLKRAATLTAMYGLAERSLHIYQEKVQEALGEKKAGLIRGEANQAVLDRDPPTDYNTHNLGGGADRCYDMMSGRYFWTDAERVRATVNQFNHELLSDNVKTLNELYSDLGLPAVELGSSVGWDSQDGLVEVLISAQVAGLEEKPCLVLDYVNRPRYLWSNN